MSVIGQHKRNLALVPYHEEWPTLFQEAAEQLRAALGPKALTIEHIGSTSIPGMKAKPIIDMMIAVSSLSEALTLVPIIETLGYTYKPYDTIPARIYFSKESAPEWRTHHLNLAVPGSDFWQNQLAFRDYLRSHPDLAAEYIELKERIAADHLRTGELDLDAKTPFVTKVLELAKIQGVEIQETSAP